MQLAELENAPDRGVCDCPGKHVKGNCDVDFPGTTHDFDYSDRQVRLMFEARTEKGIPMPVELVARALYLSDRPKELDRMVVLKGEGDDILVTDNLVTDNSSDDVTDNRRVCVSCAEVFEAKRFDAKYCSAKCRKKHSRFLALKAKFGNE